MVYLNNTTESQRVYIPRTDIQASAYHPSTGGTEQYYAGQNIEITPNNVINVTGLTEYIQNTVSGMTLDYPTSAEVESMITAATSDFVTSGEVESQITAATQNFVTSGDVASQITAATSGFVETEALTAYTPTSGFATINGSAITEGGNIVIQGGGGDLTRLEEIDTLPATPVDGAVYNYKGALIRYVEGEGNWGEWYSQPLQDTYDSRNVSGVSFYFYYGVIPWEFDHTKLCTLDYIGNKAYVFFNLSQGKLDIMSSNDSAATPYTSVTLNGATEQVPMPNASTIRWDISWKDHQIQFRIRNNYCAIPSADCCTVSSQGGNHYELVYRPSHSNIPNTGITQSAYLVGFNSDQKVTGPAFKVGINDIYVNTTGYTSANIFSIVNTRKGSNVGDRWFVPTTSGNTGDLCVAQGPTSAPVFQTIATALGVDFWTGTQAEYDALATSAGGTGYTATRLYFIKDV